MPSASLIGRAVAITGASAGIGAACARRCRDAGMDVALMARREAELARRVAELDPTGAHALAVTGDVTREEDVEQFVAATVARFGRLDAMICNAGIGFHGTLEDTTPDVMARLLDVNFMGTYYACRSALRRFEAAGRGHLVIVSSIAGRRGVPFTAGYCASKFAQVGLAEALRADLADTGIHVSLVLPVGTRTEFHDAMAREFGYRVHGVGPQQSADAVAAAIVRCLARPVPEVYPWRLAKALTVLAAVAPGLTDRLVGRYRRTREPVRAPEAGSS